MRLKNYLIEQTQKELAILIGLPASGKSTYIKRHYKNYEIVSNDKIVDSYAEKHDIDYNAAYKKIGRSTIISKGKIAFQKALKTNKSIVLDNTNLTKEIRKQYIDLAPSYKKIAVVFKVSDTVLQKRLVQRPGKTIPQEIIDKMKQDYQEPSKSEGFTEIIKA